MIEKQEDVFFYITLMNENYSHPGLKAGQEEGILKGLYLLQPGEKKGKLRVQLMGSGTILREVIAAADLLKSDWGVDADIWSAPSFTLLARDGQDAERWNMLNPTAKEARVPHITQCLQDTAGPVVVSTDYMRTFAEQVRAFIPKGRTYKVLGTDGFGRSDNREHLRRHFEVNAESIVGAALSRLAREGKIKPKKAQAALAELGLDVEARDPARA